MQLDVARTLGIAETELKQRLLIKLRKLPILRGLCEKRYEVNTQSCALEFLEALGRSKSSRATQNLQRRFFFGPEDKKDLVSLFRSHYLEDVEELVRQAESLLSDGTNILGINFKSKPDDVDWHKDPVSGKHPWPTLPMDEAFAIEVESADVKHVWEVNRHQFLTTLGRAYWMTKDPRYRDAVIDLVSSWIESNPPGIGVNWSSHLEVAMRTISWLWTMPFVLADKGKDEQFIEIWLQSIAHHYYHLRQNLSIYTDPTNHLIGEATALWMLSFCFPELPHSANSNSLASRLLMDALQAQTHNDGVNKEQATSYHRFVLDFFLQIVAICNKSDEVVPNGKMETISGMLDFVAAMEDVPVRDAAVKVADST